MQKKFIASGASLAILMTGCARQGEHKQIENAPAGITASVSAPRTSASDAQQRADLDEIEASGNKFRIVEYGYTTGNVDHFHGVTRAGGEPQVLVIHHDGQPDTVELRFAKTSPRTVAP